MGLGGVQRVTVAARVAQQEVGPGLAEAVSGVAVKG
jgi:hypothetical protein